MPRPALPSGPSNTLTASSPPNGLYHMIVSFLFLSPFFSHSCFVPGSLHVGVAASLASDYWVNEEPYEVQGDNVARGGPRKGRMHQNDQPLFKGFCFFFQSQSFDAPYPSKPELQELVKRGGAKAISRLPSRKARTRKERERETEKEREKNAEEVELKNVVICDPACMTEEEGQEIFKRCGEKPVSVEWLLGSISHYRLLDFESFTLC